MRADAEVRQETERMRAELAERVRLREGRGAYESGKTFVGPQSDGQRVWYEAGPPSRAYRLGVALSPLAPVIRILCVVLLLGLIDLVLWLAGSPIILLPRW